MNNKTIGFIGLGLIGGSLAKAIRRVHPEYTLIAYNRSTKSLADAMADGTLNQTFDTIGSGFAQCDIIFLCAPVSVNMNCLKQLKSIIKPDCILTDVGSVKTTMHKAVIELDMEKNFIGGHPMAGSEKFGYANASDRLLENAYYILTPSKKSTQAMLDELTALVQSIVSIPVVLDYKEHDKITAAISHLPHMIAFTLVNLVKESDDPEEMMKMLAAGGFKDITRIASSSPEMWQQICAENITALGEMMDTYIDRLSTINDAIKRDDKELLLDAFDSAREYRDSIPKGHGKGLIKPSFELYVDIIDESGAIATLATILASNNISIQNIGVIHNREFQDGVLRIAFYDEGAAQKATQILKKFNYVIHER